MNSARQLPVTVESYRPYQKLNTLLAAAAGTDPSTAADIRSAIEYSRRQGELPGPHTSTHDPIAKIATIHLHGRPDWAHAHLNLSLHGRDPLFIRAQLVDALRSIAGAPNAILIITGVISSIRPPGHRWSAKRRAAYRSTLHLIESIVARLSSPRSRVRIIVTS